MTGGLKGALNLETSKIIYVMQRQWEARQADATTTESNG